MENEIVRTCPSCGQILETQAEDHYDYHDKRYSCPTPRTAVLTVNTDLSLDLNPEAVERARAVQESLRGSAQEIYQNHLRMPDPLTQISEALDLYHQDLNMWKHGGIAASKFVEAVERILEKPWVRGASLVNAADFPDIPKLSVQEVKFALKSPDHLETP